MGVQSAIAVLYIYFFQSEPWKASGWWLMGVQSAIAVLYIDIFQSEPWKAVLVLRAVSLVTSSLLYLSHSLHSTPC